MVRLQIPEKEKRAVQEKADRWHRRGNGARTAAKCRPPELGDRADQGTPDTASPLPVRQPSASGESVIETLPGHASKLSGRPVKLEAVFWVRSIFPHHRQQETRRGYDKGALFWAASRRCEPPTLRLSGKRVPGSCLSAVSSPKQRPEALSGTSLPPAGEGQP